MSPPLSTLILIATTWMVGASGRFIDASPFTRQTYSRHVIASPFNFPEGTSSCDDKGGFEKPFDSCPAVHLNTRITPIGLHYKLYCGTQTHRDNIKIEPAKTFVECVDSCGDTPGCMGVDFSHVSGKCYYKSEPISIEDPTYPNVNVDTADLVLAVLTDKDTCPNLDGKLRLVMGVPFKAYCDHGLYGPGIGKATPVSSLAACVEKCAGIPECQGAEYNHETKYCYLKSEYLAKPAGKNGKLDSLIPLHKRPGGKSKSAECAGGRPFDERFEEI